MSVNGNKFMPVECITKEFCRSRIDLNDSIKITQEFDGHGNHRLSLGAQTSEWVNYHGISELQVGGVGIYRGTSDYYSGVLPRVFQLIMSFTDCTQTPRRGR